MATNAATQSPCDCCCCTNELSSALLNDGGTPCPTKSLSKTENGTCICPPDSYFSYSSDKTQCSDCISIPRLASWLSFKWLRLGGQNSPNMVYDDDWRPAGAGGVFSFLPMLTDIGGPSGGQVIFSEEGRISFDSSNNIQEELPIVGVRDATSTYFTTYNQITGVYFEYFGGNLADFDQNYGRLNRRYDTNGNVLQYQYGTSVGGNNLIRSISGDLNPNVSPYFYYSDESIPGTNWAGISTVVLHDLTNVNNNRVIYFQYQEYSDPITFNEFAYLSKIVNPTGCTQLFDPVVPFNDNFDAYQLKREVDAEGYATYFTYVGATLSKVNEPEGRVVYYDYSVFGETHQIPLGRSKQITLYDVSSFGDQMFLVKRNTDALGNTTYYGYDATLKRITQQVDPNGNITYYQHVGGSALNKYAKTLQLSAFNGAQTYYGYNGAYDLTKQVGPRQTSSFSQTTYYQYDVFRNRTVMVDALTETTLYGRDSRGHLARLKDARGNTTYYNYSSVTGNQDSMSDALGNTTYYGYNSFRDKLREVNPRWAEKSMAAFTTYYAYDQLSRKTTMVDPLNNVTYWDYTARSLLMDQVDAVGTDTNYTYNGLRLMTQKTVTAKNGTQLSQDKFGYDIYKNRTSWLDPRLNTTYYFYDQIDRMTAQVDALLDMTYYYYDSVSNRTAVTDARGNTTYFGYDQLSRMTAMRDALGDSTYYFYDLANNRTQVVDPRGNPAYFFFDQLDRPLANRDALANPTYFFYDLVGNQSAITDARFDTTYYFYDNDNRNNVIRDALANITYYSYDANSNKTKMVDARGNTSSWVYDALNRMSVSLDALSDPTYFGYDGVGNNIQTMDARFNTTYFYFDGLKRNTVIKDALSDLTYFYYDPSNNRTALRNPNLHTTYFGFDQINRLSRIQDALGNTTYYQYDPVSNLTLVLDPDLHSTQTQYDSVNRVSALRYADSGSPYFFYDAASNRIKDVDPLGKATYYGYDALNRAVQMADAFFRTVYFQYDAVSNLSKEVGAEGESAAYTYDALNRKTNIAYAAAGAVVSTSISSRPYYIYDQSSNLVQMGDLWGLHLMGYDADNRLVRDLYPNQSVVYFEYDPVWNNTTVAYPGNSGRCGMGYDAINRMTRVQSPSSDTAYFAYDPASNLIQRLLFNGVNLTASYDACERIQSWRYASSGGASLSYFDYTRDSKGLITKAVREANYTVYYSYDPCDRLASEVWATTGSTPSEVYGYRYAYDLSGNRLRARINGANTYYFYDQANQLTVKGSTSAFASPTYYLYNKDGSLTNLVPSTGAATYFAYNAAALIAQIQWADASVTYFFYDGALRRYGMNAFGTMTYFLWNGPNMLQEFNLNGTVKDEHTHGTTLFAGIGQVVETNRPGTTGTAQKITPVMDMRGTITKWVESNGSTILASQEYESFGTVIPGSAVGTWPNRFSYQGQTWIQVTSMTGAQTLLLSPTRPYYPTDGTFIQKDSLARLALTGREFDPNFYGLNTRGIYDSLSARLKSTKLIDTHLDSSNLAKLLSSLIILKPNPQVSSYAYSMGSPTSFVDYTGLAETCVLCKKEDCSFSGKTVWIIPIDCAVAGNAWTWPIRQIALFWLDEEKKAGEKFCQEQGDVNCHCDAIGQPPTILKQPIVVPGFPYPLWLCQVTILTNTQGTCHER